MKPIYTVYTLSDDSLEVRYVGVTSQTLTKRLHDMMSACDKPYTPSFNTPAGQWLRTLLEEGKKPAFFVKYEGFEKEEADEVYRFQINNNLHTGKLLNSTAGHHNGIRTTQMTEKGPGGRTISEASAHSFNSIRRKTKKAST